MDVHRFPAILHPDMEVLSLQEVQLSLGYMARNEVSEKERHVPSSVEVIRGLLERIVESCQSGGKKR